MSSAEPPPPRRERIPVRYETTPAMLFERAIGARLRPGMAILDVGAGRRPAIAREAVGEVSRYVGLDVSAAELRAAPAGAYSETVVADLTSRVDALGGQFDLVVSWQVLEHVADTAVVLENIRYYLRSGGALVALLSGTLALQAVVSRLVPSGLAKRLLRDLLDRPPDSVFPAHYDHCDAAGLAARLEPWSEAAVTPLYQGGAYLNFSPRLRRAYFAYEDWAWRSGRARLASHYLIIARR